MLPTRDETYSESAKGLRITRERALVELRSHAVTDPADFFAECGDRPTYVASVVLEWLGY